ncbi:hypothetical protein NL520_28300, partial [Klebsiella pneumoniae]|nr:hypothetical protein [Klebsiella pneumoniae]
YCLASERLAELDARLDQLQWSDSPHEDLRALLTELATVRIPGSELKALRPAIDQHFALPDLLAIRDALRRESRPELRDWA